MMNRKFTNREIVLILILCILLLGVLYYEIVVKETDKMIEQYNTEELESQLLIEQTKALSMMKMKNEMASPNLKATGIVPSYNNIKNEIKVLNDIFAKANSYNLDFQQAIKSDNVVRRDINITFSAGNYTDVKSILKDIHNCKYRCLIRSINVVAASPESSGIKGGGDVNAVLTVTFYETLYNANTTAGLEEIDEQANQ